tara:strand:+ start:522 stop:731 length:210 start_codon:yes stop_codon:yes gene_type:complete
MQFTNFRKSLRPGLGLWKKPTASTLNRQVYDATHETDSLNVIIVANGKKMAINVTTEELASVGLVWSKS